MRFGWLWVSEMMRSLDPFVDVRCYNGHCMDNYIQAGKSFDDLRAELTAAGDEAWLYHNIRGSFFPAEWMRLINGFYLWIGCQNSIRSYLRHDALSIFQYASAPEFTPGSESS